MTIPRFACLACAVLLIAGCASSPPAKPAAGTSSDPGTTGRTGQSPAGTANFGANNIPEVLMRAVEDTYRKPVPLDCATLGAEIAALDAMLGPDVDTLKAADRPGHVVETALLGAIKGMVPYHGVLRLFSGARQRERRIAEAVAAGDIRRGYLKGLGESAGCVVPAAPVRGDTVRTTARGKRAG